MQYGQRISPRFSYWFGQRWEEALEKDQEVSQLKYLIEEAEELLKDSSLPTPSTLMFA